MYRDDFQENVFSRIYEPQQLAEPDPIECHRSVTFSAEKLIQSDLTG